MQKSEKIEISSIEINQSLAYTAKFREVSFNMAYISSNAINIHGTES